MDRSPWVFEVSGTDGIFGTIFLFELHDFTVMNVFKIRQGMRVQQQELGSIDSTEDREKNDYFSDIEEIL